jgi:thiol-disulfide isomerase/thioredoxin
MKTIAIYLVLLLTGVCTNAQQVKAINIQQLDSIIKNTAKPLVINFWATFCKPCIEEIPYFEAAVNDYKKNDIEMILVSVDLPDYYPSKIKTFAARKKITSKIVWLNETNADIFCAAIDAKWNGEIPVSLMINNKNNYRRFYNHQLTPAQVKKAFADLVK